MLKTKLAAKAIAYRDTGLTFAQFAAMADVKAACYLNPGATIEVGAVYVDQRGNKHVASWEAIKDVDIATFLTSFHGYNFVFVDSNPSQTTLTSLDPSKKPLTFEELMNEMGIHEDHALYAILACGGMREDVLPMVNEQRGNPVSSALADYVKMLKDNKKHYIDTMFKKGFGEGMLADWLKVGQIVGRLTIDPQSIMFQKLDGSIVQWKFDKVRACSKITSLSPVKATMATNGNMARRNVR
ncbi:MAG: hypothetical protein JW839_10505, partial [Candidatus Lokiarchaeota archaeon]|nr:hypothetical protein [Candidatus Lokiarchaeota archaeon]